MLLLSMKMTNVIVCCSECYLLKFRKKVTVGCMCNAKNLGEIADSSRQLYLVDKDFAMEPSLGLNYFKGNVLFRKKRTMFELG